MEAVQVDSNSAANVNMLVIVDDHHLAALRQNGLSADVRPIRASLFESLRKLPAGVDTIVAQKPTYLLNGDLQRAIKKTPHLEYLQIPPSPLLDNFLFRNKLLDHGPSPQEVSESLLLYVRKNYDTGATCKDEARDRLFSQVLKQLGRGLYQRSQVYQACEIVEREEKLWPACVKHVKRPVTKPLKQVAKLVLPNEELKALPNSPQGAKKMSTQTTKTLTGNMDVARKFIKEYVKTHTIPRTFPSGGLTAVIEQFTKETGIQIVGNQRVDFSKLLNPYRSVGKKIKRPGKKRVAFKATAKKMVAKPSVKTKKITETAVIATGEDIASRAANQARAVVNNFIGLPASAKAIHRTVTDSLNISLIFQEAEVRSVVRTTISFLNETTILLKQALGEEKS